MSESRKNLIDELVADLRPIKRPGQIGRSASLWLSIAIVYSVVIVLVTGPLRDGALRHLIELPLFAGETLLAVIAIGAVAFGSLRSAIPGEPGPARILRYTFAPLAAWAAVYIVGLWYPVHPVSTLGARNYCIWQVVLYSLPMLGLLLYIARRQYPLWPRTTAMLCGAAAAAIPAELMQFGCMYVPSHILTHHMSPILITAVIGALVGPFVLKVGPRAPRHGDVSVH
jgi:hypothetical protein